MLLPHVLIVPAHRAYEHVLTEIPFVNQQLCCSFPLQLSTCPACTLILVSSPAAFHIPDSSGSSSLLGLNTPRSCTWHQPRAPPPLHRTDAHVLHSAMGVAA